MCTVFNKKKKKTGPRSRLVPVPRLVPSARQNRDSGRKTRLLINAYAEGAAAASRKPFSRGRRPCRAANVLCSFCVRPRDLQLSEFAKQTKNVQRTGRGPAPPPSLPSPPALQRPAYCYFFFFVFCHNSFFAHFQSTHTDLL